jgi:TonB family protein
MMSSRNNGYTASDIERYHSGKMLPEERHALEKAALDDPFLADALEGYTFTSTASDDLAKLRARLNEKSDRKKVVPIFQKYRWISAAAIVLIIAGVGWLVYSVSQKENKTFTALKREQPAKDSNNTVTSSPNLLPDSAVDKKPVIVQPVAKNQPKLLNKKNDQTNSRPLALHAKKQIGNSKDSEVAADNQNEAVAKTMDVSPAQSQVPGSTAKISNVQNGGYLKINKAASIEPRFNNASNEVANRQSFYKKADTNNNPSGKVAGIAPNDTIKNLNIVLKPLPTDSLQTVVIIGYGTQKKSSARYPQVIIDTLEPAEGYVHFDDYVASNLKMPEELKNKPVEGEVQLSFDVDEEGQPTNITVVKSLCPKCDEEAIRLLKEGPKWKQKKNKKGKLTIKF